MNILLLSMPDSSEHTPTVSMRMPNGALSSLAGNIDPHHQIAVADLILVVESYRNQMYFGGALIVGNPTDTRESVEANFEFARASRYIEVIFQEFRGSHEPEQSHAIVIH